MTLPTHALSHMPTICLSQAKSLVSPSLGVTTIIYDQHIRWLYLTHTPRDLREVCDFAIQLLTSTQINLHLRSLPTNIMARGKRTPRLREASPAAPEADNTIAGDQVETPNEHEQMLDPSSSERRYWRDPLTGVQREIWRPGTFLTKGIV